MSAVPQGCAVIGTAIVVVCAAFDNQPVDRVKAVKTIMDTNCRGHPGATYAGENGRAPGRVVAPVSSHGRLPSRRKRRGSADRFEATEPSGPLRSVIVEQTTHGACLLVANHGSNADRTLAVSGPIADISFVTRGKLCVRHSLRPHQMRPGNTEIRSPL